MSLLRMQPALGRLGSCVLALATCVLWANCTTERPREQLARATGPSARAAEGERGTTHDAAVDRVDAAAKRSSVSAQDSAVASDTSPAGHSDDDAGLPPPQATLHAAVAQACGAAPDTSSQSFTRERLRAAAADCAAWHYCGFRVAAVSLQEATETYAREGTDSTLDAARSAYRDALLMWSRAELFQFGPASSAAMSAGKDSYQGQGLRDRVYAWPVVAPCRVQEQIVLGPDSVEQALISGRGLFAIEHALFGIAQSSACPDGVKAAQSWSEWTQKQRVERASQYAAAAARDVREQVDTLLTAFGPDAYPPKLVSASGYPSEQEALDVIAWSLIYVERELKDWKLGIPAGYTQSAPVTLPETPYLGLGTEAMRENMRGFRALFEGCAEDGSGLGFDDWLTLAGHAELATDLLSAQRDAQAALDALAPLDEASPAALDAAYQAVRELTVLLKAELFGAGSPLGLKLPASVEGDTD